MDRKEKLCIRDFSIFLDDCTTTTEQIFSHTCLVAMETKTFIEHLHKSDMVKEISEEFGISEEVAIQRILVALSTADFTNQILDPLKSYLNKIEYLEDTNGKISIVNMDNL